MAFWERGPKQPDKAQPSASEPQQPTTYEQLKSGLKERLSSELEILGMQTGNRFSFSDIGREEALTKIKLDESLKDGLPELELRLVKYLQSACAEYLAAPTFTDEFHKDHASRREWEGKYMNTDGALLNYYKKNRLGTNVNDSVIGLLRLIVNHSDNEKLKEVLAPLVADIPPECIERTKDGNLIYDFLDDDLKIQTSQKVARLARQILDKLEAPIVSE